MAFVVEGITGILWRLLALPVQPVARRIPRKATRPQPTRGGAARRVRSFQAFVSPPARAEQARPAVAVLDRVVVEEATLDHLASWCELLAFVAFSHGYDAFVNGTHPLSS